MKYNKILVNGAEIIREITYNSCHSKFTGKYALHVVIKGEVNFTIEKRNITLAPGSFIFLNSDTVYTQEINSTMEVEKLTILLDADFIQEFEDSSLFKEYLLPDCPENFNLKRKRLVESIYPLEGDIKFNVLQLIRQIEDGVKNPQLLKAYLNHTLLDYYDLYNSEITKRAASLQFLNGSTKTEILRRLSVARDYMISNYKKRIQLDEIAQVACLSVNHLLRTFKQAYQQSPHQFLTGVRLQQAKYLLRNTNYPVGEIVDIVGFECPSSFIRLFRNSFNVTPGQYR
ncbi:AraC family transcriptional regulator [Pedobacter nyackensis]|uniref:AraC family transcriptional regulator n=1 Tax=Pedobacter nyackensis TaxID=475255 RepID=UPI00293068AE|nr:AraC family transcriptional regulator [Pedobacter nyackensis]